MKNLEMMMVSIPAFMDPEFTVSVGKVIAVMHLMQ